MILNNHGNITWAEYLTNRDRVPSSPWSDSARAVDELVHGHCKHYSGLFSTSNKKMTKRDPNEQLTSWSTVTANIILDCFQHEIERNKMKKD